MIWNALGVVAGDDWLACLGSEHDLLLDPVSIKGGIDPFQMRQVEVE